MATSTDFQTGQGAAADSAVKDLDQLYNQAKTGRAWLEPIWILNLAYYNGDQWLAWNGRQLFQPNLRPNRITIVDNRIQGCVRTEIAKLTKNNPIFTVAPATADDEDVNAADLGEHVMRYLWDHLHAQEITTKALLWSRICGAGFVKVFWDATVGDSTEVLVASATNKVLQDAQGAPMRPQQVQPGMLEALGLDSTAVRVKRVARGDVRLEARSPFQMFPDPLCDTFDEAEWIIEESVKSREYVRRVFNEDLVPDTPANPGMVEVKMGSFIPGSSPYKGIKLREFWAKPSSQYPGGRRVVWAQGRVLKEDRPFDPLPYVMLSSIPVPGRLWPTSITEQLRGPQTELNKVKSQMAENRNRVGNPTVLASRQAVQDPEKFADSISNPGGIFWFDDIGSPNAVPKYLESPALPEYVVDEVQRIEESMEAISGQHEVTNAQVPPGVTAASAINLLMEADDTRLGPAIRDFEHQLGKLGQKVLGLVGNYYTDQRTIRIAGDNGAWQIFDFRGAMLKGNTHVQVQAGSAFPHSKAAKQAALTDLLHMMAQMGHQLDPKQLAQFLQDYEVGGADKLIEQYTKSEAQANRENVLLMQGQPIPINDYDDDDVHLTNHEDFERSARFQNAPPELQHIHLAHTAAHRQRQQQAQQQQLQNEAMLAGKLPPNLTEAAFQQEQQLSQMQGVQQVQAAQQQAQMQQQGQAQQQGFDQAAQEQQQRHAQEQHELRLAQMHREQQRAEELHQQKMHQAEQTHQESLRLRAQQAEQQARQQNQNQNRDRKAA